MIHNSVNCYKFCYKFYGKDNFYSLIGANVEQQIQTQKFCLFNFS